MGIQGLVPWATSSHKGLIKLHHQRFADARIAGKRIAIDGTLMTMRFHFGGFHEEDDAFRRKAAVIGWFNLISEMKESGVKPITIWDQRGTRPWKAAEARRRLLRRTEFLARLRHEEARAERLVQWQAAFDDFESLSDIEQDIIKNYSQKNVIQVSMPVKPRPGPPKSGSRSKSVASAKSPDTRHTSPDSTLSATTAATATPPATVRVPGQVAPDATPSVSEIRSVLPAPMAPEDAEGIFERVSEYLSTLSTLIADYDAHNKPFTLGHKAETPEVLHAIKQVRELEEVVQGAPLPLSPPPPAALADGAETASVDADGVDVEPETALIDLVIEEVVPMDTFTETAKQTELTREEGLLVNAFFLQGAGAAAGATAAAAADTGVDGTLGESLKTPSLAAAAETKALFVGTPRERLEAIFEVTPQIRKTFERALHSPPSSVHADCRELLVAMGVPVLEAQVPYEAEGLGVALWKAGLVDYVGTEDTDVLAYGAPLMRNMTGQHGIQVIHGSELRQASALSPSSFLDFCILLGTDASPRIPSVGPVRAFKYMTKYGSIEAMLDAEPKVRAKIADFAEYMGMVRAAREVFGKLPEVPDGVELQQGARDEAAVERLLEEKHGVRLVERVQVPGRAGWEVQADEVRFEDIDEVWAEHAR